MIEPNLYPETKYTGRVELALFDRENYNLLPDEKFPKVVLSTPMK